MEDSEAVERRCDLPFGAEYAKSGRAACKGCKSTIGQNQLRMSAREPSRFFDGLQDNWFHFSCFFKKLKPGKDKINERSIRGIESLKWDDQESIRCKISEFDCSSITGSSRDGNQYSAFKVEYSKSNRGKCSICSRNFTKNELKVARKSAWFHIDCGMPATLILEGKLEDIGGFATLTEEDKIALTSRLTPMDSDVDEKKVEVSDSTTTEPLKRINGKASFVPTTTTSAESTDLKRSGAVASGLGVSGRGVGSTDESAAKRPRFQPKVKSESEKLKEKLKKQTDLMWELRNGFQTNLKKAQMIRLLTENKQIPPTEESKILDLLVDCALFGKPAACPKCPNGQIVFSLSKRTYVCLGFMTEYTKCIYESKNPVRMPFTISYDMIEGNEFLKNVQVNLLTARVYCDSNEKIIDRSDISTFKYLGARGNKNAAEMYEDYGTKSMGMGSGTSRQIIKDGTVVDNEFPHAEVCHVHRDEQGSVYMTTLGVADMVLNTNSYYKIHLFKHDSRDDFYVFRSWGRVGTNVGGTKLDSYHKADRAVEQFKSLFLEKTGNEWENRKYFRKKAGFMGIIETDYSEFENVKSETVIPGSLTKLHRSIKEIVLMIFDVENMKSAMKGFELDLDRMPLGKLSKKQIMRAYEVLTELQTILESAHPDEHRVLDASNRFYTLIPHNFGMKSAEMLSNHDILKKKCTMLDSLLEIEFAYSVLQDDKKDTVLSEGRDPVDVHYEKLHCDMEYVEPTSDDFAMVKKYVKNTHGKTHSGYSLEVVDVIRLNRHGERDSFRKDIGNRMLLWHGSGRANYSGILSQGLRIAPPEAPVTGYMFGKGVYFADMVSKSANYCRVGWNEEGFLLLCDVALGTVKQELNAVTHTKNTVHPQYQSVKGMGMTIPSPPETIQHPDGYSIPLGQGVTVDPVQGYVPPTGKKGKGKKAAPAMNYSSLLYNEYIVYDVNQINLRYLVRTKFKHAY